MIPNLTLIVASYVVFRCIEIMSHESRRELGTRSTLIFIFGILTIVVTAICTVATLASGSK